MLKLLFGNQRDRTYLLYFFGLLARGINVSGVSAEALGLDARLSECYANSGGPHLDLVLQTLTFSSQDAALDLGCGKAGAMITMAQYGFARVDGVEISERLAEVAVKHLARAQVTNASVFCCDAADFEDFDPYTVLYMYHPFREPVVRAVLKHLVASLARHPRKITLLYRNPVYHDLVMEAGFRQTAAFYHCMHPLHIYVFTPEGG